MLMFPNEGCYLKLLTLQNMWLEAHLTPSLCISAYIMHVTFYMRPHIMVKTQRVAFHKDYGGAFFLIDVN